MDGILLVDKPAGISSFGAVARVRGIIKTSTGQKIKIGHTGTLDPAASGLLILVLGKYTKRASEFSKLDKTYETELTLGQSSTTGDVEGELTRLSTVVPGDIQVVEVLERFKGEIMQTPPIYSAIKVDGHRAYKMAREGKEFVLQARQVTIYSIDDVDYDYPRLSFTTRVSSGTYIRSLAEDIGDQLGTGAYMSSLRRLGVGEYSVKDSIHIDNLEYSDIIHHVKQIPPA